MPLIFEVRADATPRKQHEAMALSVRMCPGRRRRGTPPQEIKRAHTRTSHPPAPSKTPCSFYDPELPLSATLPLRTPCSPSPLRSPNGSLAPLRPRASSKTPCSPFSATPPNGPRAPPPSRFPNRPYAPLLVEPISSLRTRMSPSPPRSLMDP
nr:proline-rich protein 36-like [Penaeus vannamei]